MISAVATGFVVFFAASIFISLVLVIFDNFLEFVAFAIASVFLFFMFYGIGAIFNYFVKVGA